MNPYQLYYWPGLQGRGEFVRLALVEGGLDYVDVVRRPEAEGGGVPSLLRLLREPSGLPPLAPPILVAGDLVIAQVANILLFLGRRHGLAPGDEAGLYHANQLQLTVTDLVAEIHDTHHPIASAEAYETQRVEAKRRAAYFAGARIAKYLGYFERVLEGSQGHGGAYIFGADPSYVDTSLFQVMTGIEYAFPRAFSRVVPEIPRLCALRDAIAARPRIAAYLSSPARLPLNETGIFRRYPELDEA